MAVCATDHPVSILSEILINRIRIRLLLSIPFCREDQEWDKLIVRPESNELFDLKTDPDDRKDLLLKNPSKVQKLVRLIGQWLGDTPVQ